MALPTRQKFLDDAARARQAVAQSSTGSPSTSEENRPQNPQAARPQTDASTAASATASTVKGSGSVNGVQAGERRGSAPSTSTPSTSHSFTRPPRNVSGAGDQEGTGTASGAQARKTSVAAVRARVERELAAKEGRGVRSPSTSSAGTSTPSLKDEPKETREYRGDPSLERRLAASREKNKKIIPVDSASWKDVDPEGDPTKGLGAEPYVKKGRKPTRKRQKRMVLRDRDFEIVRFIARYRFASRAQLERHFDVVDLSRRLTQLKNAGFVHNEMVTRTQSLWTATTAGMDLVDLDFPILVGNVNPSTIAHTLGLVNIGSDLATGKLDTTLLPEDLEQDPDGEVIITEREMTQSFNYTRELIGPVRVREEYLDSWGEEPWTYLLHVNDINSPRHGKSHKPDMVIDRGGKGEDIAIELELSAKRTGEWKEILRMFKASPYKKVIYYTHKRSIANSLAKIDANDIGLGDRLDIRTYRPLHSNIPFWG